ncbi:MAG TPA: polyprenyl synthetase family protein, partial [Spirochaetota bacterium]|nr:polyprenyl synthetase family protein [Spirochaetota bacterium]
MYERTALGQLLDIIWSHPERISNDDIAEMIAAMKTAHYTVAGPLKLGYILAGGNDSDELQRLTEMGYSLGFAFQMRDDIIGVFG